MSKLADFHKKVAANPDLVAQVQKIQKDNGLSANSPLSSYSDEAINSLISFAKKEGFDFTLAEVKTFANESVLSDAELEAVAGGAGGPHVCIISGGK